MRQIKFRGKRVDGLGWAYGSLNTWQDGTCEISHSELNDEMIKSKVDPATVGQFTGLLDKNGKEIYESDWCTAMFTTREGIKAIQGYIFMDEYMWCIDCTGYDGDNIFSINRPHAFEIIGNLHDSPSLTNH